MDLSPLKILSAVYRLRVSGKVTAKSKDGKRTRFSSIGFSDLDCKTCDDRKERGCFLLGSDQSPGDDVFVIDHNSSLRPDKINFCPASFREIEPYAMHAVRTWDKINSAGGASAWFGTAINSLPNRVSWTLHALEEIKARFLSQAESERNKLSSV